MEIDDLLQRINADNQWGLPKEWQNKTVQLYKPKKVVGEEQLASWLKMCGNIYCSFIKWELVDTNRLDTPQLRCAYHLQLDAGPADPRTGIPCPLNCRRREDQGTTPLCRTAKTPKLLALSSTPSTARWARPWNTPKWSPLYPKPCLLNLGLAG